jgi:hypothetical protein
MCHKLDPVFFQRLKDMSPDDVCRRSLAAYDAKRAIYRLSFLYKDYEVDPGLQIIKPINAGDGPVSMEAALVIVFYLLQARDIPLSRKWVSEFQLKGGAIFFRGPHAVRNSELSSHFGHDVEGFKGACQTACGQPVDMGDAAFRFDVLPRIPAIVAFWYADEEFDATAKLLMDATIEQHLPLDVIFGMSLELYSRIVGRDLG